MAISGFDPGQFHFTPFIFDHNLIFTDHFPGVVNGQIIERNAEREFFTVHFPFFQLGFAKLRFPGAGQFLSLRFERLVDFERAVGRLAGAFPVAVNGVL